MEVREVGPDLTRGRQLDRIRVVHFVDALGGSDHLWGKENVIVTLMQAQRESGCIDAELITFTPGLLGETMRQAGFRVSYLDERRYRNPIGSLGALRRMVGRGSLAVLHTHEYKANIVGRLARARGLRMRKLVATDHGWVDSTPRLEVYFAVDRLTAPFSDAVTVTDPAMLARFGPCRPRSLTFVPNAVLDLPCAGSSDRSAARARFGFDSNAFVVGSLGRLTKNKGILDILRAAEKTRDAGISWAIAGSGALAAAVESSALPNVRFVGYQADSATYLQALDAYVQASYFEGLSLSLLEAMRSGLPCIASRAGATELALRDDGEALLVEAGNIDALADAALRLRADRALQRSLAAAARRRFEAAFTVVRQHEAFMKIYLA